VSGCKVEGCKVIGAGFRLRVQDVGVVEGRVRSLWTNAKMTTAYSLSCWPCKTRTPTTTNHVSQKTKLTGQN